jgi:acetyl coenzyme A synthetase (ADP forming)-like protein
MSSILNQGKDLKSLFEPDSVAVIGASTNTEKIGHKILKNIVEAGFRGKVYPVNPRGGEILELKTYTSIVDIPGELETVVIVIPARFVPSVIEECVKKGVKGAIIISSGFRDIGPKGANLERQILEIAKSGGLRIIGPNCQGLSNPVTGFCATWPIIKEVGNVAVISQSGTVALEVPTFLAWNDLGYSKSVSLGNKADVDEADLINWLAEDDNTRVISIFTEGMKDGRKLMKAVKKASSQKPVLILKGGKSEAGKRAVLAHTGSLAGSNDVFEAAMKQSGGLCLNGLEELCSVSKAFSCLPIPRGNRLLIISSSGGAGILSADSCEGVDLVLSNLSEQTLEKLRNKLPEYCIIGNPLDLTGNAFSNPEMYEMALEIVLEESSVDMILVIFGDPIPNSYNLLEKQVKKAKKLGVPIAVNYLGGADVQENEIKNLQKNGVPVFPTPNRAINALSYMYRYSFNRIFKEGV